MVYENWGAGRGAVDPSIIMFTPTVRHVVYVAHGSIDTSVQFGFHDSDFGLTFFPKIFKVKTLPEISAVKLCYLCNLSWREGDRKRDRERERQRQRQRETTEREIPRSVCVERAMQDRKPYCTVPRATHSSAEQFFF